MCVHVSVFVGLLIIAHSRGTDFLLTCRSAHFSDHYVMYVYKCVIIAHPEESELLRKHTSPQHKSAASEDPDSQPSTFLGAKAANFHWQRRRPNKRQRYDPVWCWMTAQALCPFSPGWIVTVTTPPGVIHGEIQILQQRKLVFIFVSQLLHLQNHNHRQWKSLRFNLPRLQYLSFLVKNLQKINTPIQKANN